MRKLRHVPVVFCFFAILVALSKSISAQSQNPVAPSLITSPVVENARVTLRGNIHPMAQFDLGPAPVAARADRLMLILKRSPQQEAALNTYLSDVQDAASAQFHKFLTPEEFGRRFGISDQGAAQVKQWLASHGFSVAGMNKGRTAIEFSGTIGQVEQAFRTSIHRFRIAGAEHLANIDDPLIPAALAPVIGGVTSLNDFKPQPNIVAGPKAKWDANLHRFTPDLTISGSEAQYLLLGPGDAATIYNTPNSLNTRLASGQVPYDGTGVTIGIAGTTVLGPVADTFYRQMFGLEGFNIQGAGTVIDGNPGNLYSYADQTEATADIEIAEALAPGASVLYYAAGDTAFQSGLFLAIYRALDDNRISILNVSYGECEAALGTSGNLQVLNAWKQAAAQGITVTVSSGDSGSAGCDNQNLVTAATQGFGVNGLASTPYNIAVGGTDYDALGGAFSTYVGPNSANFTSALSYIPEEPWNDSTQSNGALASNKALVISGQTSIWAGGGGKSSAANSSGGYPKPDWQRGFSPSNTDSVRDLPDVSLFAGAAHYNAMWALCIAGDCAEGSASTIHGVGGTSTSAPALAGILALVTQKLGSGARLGQANWVLYKLAQTTPSIFHSITNGNNSVYCKTGSPNCGSNNFLTGYNAQPKYNMATGLGSIDATQLVNHWNDASRGATTTTLSLDKTTFTHGSAVTVTAGVNPTSATGAVAITNDYASQPDATSGSPTRTMLSLSNGTASGSYSQFPGGTYNMYASYGGDGNHGGSVSQPVKVTVAPEDSVLKLSVDSVNSSYQLVNAAGKTLPLGTFITVNAQPVGVSQAASSHPVTNATGAVMFYDQSASIYPWGDKAQLDSTGNSEANTLNLEAGQHSISAVYLGDLSYNGTTSDSINFTIAPVNTAIAITATPTSTIQEQVQLVGQVTAPISAAASFLTHVGLITFTDVTRNAVLGTAQLEATCQGATTFCFAGYLQVDSTQLAAGDNSIVASFAGDSNFNASGNSAPVTVTCQASCWNAAGQRLSLGFYQSTPTGPLSAGQSSTTPVDVSEYGGFKGDVNLTCTVAGKNSGDQHIPTCSFNPAKVTIASDQAVESILTLSTTAPTKSAIAKPNRAATSWVPVTISFASLLLCLVPGRKFRRRYLLMVALMFLSLASLTACSGGGSSSGGSGGGGGGGGTTVPGTTPDIYTVTFRAVDAATGTVTAQDYFNFTVQ